MEPPNNGHILEQPVLLFIERLSSLWRLKCTGIIERGPQSERDLCLYREVYSIVSFI